MAQVFLACIDETTFPLPPDFLSSRTSLRFVRFRNCRVLYDDSTINPKNIALHSNFVQFATSSPDELCEDFVSFCNQSFKQGKLFQTSRNFHSLEFWFTYIDPTVHLDMNKLKFCIELEFITY